MPDQQFVSPDDHAIIVGINRYRDGIEQLQGAVNDAELFHAWVIDPKGGGLDPDNAKLIVSSGNGPLAPRLADIEDAIMIHFERLFNTGRPVGRRLYLFLAGHGVAPPDGDDCSLVAADSHLDPYRLLTGRMTADRILRRPMFQEVVFFMACCRDVRTQAPSSGVPDPAQPLPNAKYCYGMAVKWGKRAIEKELPHPLNPEGPKLWQSIFSHAVLRGLQSAIDDAGQVTSLSLKKFVKKQVEELLPPDDKRPPKFDIEEEEPPIVFKRGAPLSPVIMPGGGGGPRRIAAEDQPPRRLRRGGARRSETPAVAGRAEDSGQVVLATNGLIPVDVILSGDATDFEVLDGVTLTKLAPPMERTRQGRYKVYLRPSLYAFRVPGGELKPARVLGEALSVTL